MWKLSVRKYLLFYREFKLLKGVFFFFKIFGGLYLFYFFVIKVKEYLLSLVIKGIGYEMYIKLVGILKGCNINIYFYYKCNFL